MPNAWFRKYAEWLDDEKVQMMPFDMQRHLDALFCLRCTRPTEQMTETQIAFRLRIDETLLKRCKETFLKQGFIDDNWAIVNWSKRQFLSDSSTERVRRFRENKGSKQDETFHETDETQNETAPDTEQIHIQNRTEPKTITPSSATNGAVGSENLFNTSPSDESVLAPRDHHLSEKVREKRKRMRAAVRRLFAYYIQRTERHPKAYTLTLSRMDKGLARLEDCMRKTGGDLDKAEQLMQIAIDNLMQSEFHQGKNDRRKEYTDWTQHMFRSTEKLEWWLAR